MKRYSVEKKDIVTVDDDAVSANPYAKKYKVNIKIW